MIERFASKARRFRDEARKILSRNESSTNRVITLSVSYNALSALSLKQDELFRQSLRCIENELYRAAHVLSWAAFIDFFEEKITSDGFIKLRTAYPAWAHHPTIDELRENVPEYQLIDAGKKTGLLTKNETKALHGLLNKRNECAHPSNYFPGLNDSLGYISELVQRVSHLQGKHF